MGRLRSQSILGNKLKVQIITPWYPSSYHPYRGIFVKNQVRALREIGVDVAVEVPTIFPAPRGPVPPLVWNGADQLAMQNPDLIFPTIGDAIQIPCPVPSGSGIPGRFTSFSNGLKMKRNHLPFDADLEHVHVGLPTAASVASLSDRPLVITEHSSQAATQCSVPAVAEMYRKALESSSAFICVSGFLQREISESLNVEINSKWKVVPNIVNFDSFSFVMREKFQCSSWIYVGALFNSKGVVELLRVFALYKKQIDPEVTLTLVGEGTLKTWIERFSRSRGIYDSVNIVGPQSQENVHKYLAQADLMVHLSPYETFGLVSLEAIASGLPVISLKNGGAEETWGDLQNSCGQILDSKLTEEEIVEAIHEFSLKTSDLDLRFASDSLKKRFSPSAVTSKLIEIYESIL